MKSGRTGGSRQPSRSRSRRSVTSRKKDSLLSSTRVLSSTSSLFSPTITAARSHEGQADRHQSFGRSLTHQGAHRSSSHSSDLSVVASRRALSHSLSSTSSRSGANELSLLESSLARQSAKHAGVTPQLLSDSLTTRHVKLENDNDHLNEFTAVPSLTSELFQKRPQTARIPSSHNAYDTLSSTMNLTQFVHPPALARSRTHSTGPAERGALTNLSTAPTSAHTPPPYTMSKHTLHTAPLTTDSSPATSAATVSLRSTHKTSGMQLRKPPHMIVSMASILDSPTSSTTTHTSRNSNNSSSSRHRRGNQHDISQLSTVSASTDAWLASLTDGGEPLHSTPFRALSTTALYKHCVDVFDQYHQQTPVHPNGQSSRSIATVPGLPTRAVYTYNPQQQHKGSNTALSSTRRSTAHPLHIPHRGLKGTWKPAPGGAYEVGKEPKAGEEDTGLTGKLDEFCTDLTKEAAEGKLDPMIGRHEILQRTVEVLSRRRKNNPILTGEPGTGKTAIVEGLAQLIVQNEVPQSLQNSKIYTLDLARLVSGTSFRGEFEERLLGIINDLQKRPEVILFVDEVHQLVGAGKTDGAMDAANILKPALARGRIRFMGATTTKEYTQHIEKDGALNRRFEPIHVPEPSVNDTITILRGLKGSYEEHHQVKFMDNAMVAAATMAKRYFSDRKLPDKAIDLLDEAASHVCILLESKPSHLLLLEQDLLYSRMEHRGLENDTDHASKQRRTRLAKRIERLARVYKAKMERWETRKRLRKAVMDLERDVKDHTTKGMKLALQDPPPSAEYMMQFANELSFKQIDLVSAKNAYEEYNKAHSFKDDDTVTHDTIAEVVARHTGVPVTKLLSQDKEKLLNLEDELRKRVVAQDHALEAVSTCVRVARAGLHDGRRPQGVFLFCGPSGVGKTELCKALADNLYGSSDAMIRLDMSEYSEQHSVARLIGAAPGYIGYEEGGQLTEAVRKRPYQVVLLDEIEKAHKQVVTVLLQVMEEASLTDGKGNQVDFSNTILIMTSNLGAHEAVEWSASNTTETEESKNLISKEIMTHAVKRHFAPEFINRINDIVMFNSLRRENMDSIVKIQLGHVEQLLSDNNNSLIVSPGAQHEMAERGFDPVYGARPIKRTIYRDVTQVIAQAILSGDVDKNTLIVMKRHDEDDLLFDLDDYDLVDTEGTVLENAKIHADPIYTFKVYKKRTIEKKDTRETYDLSNDEDDRAFREAEEMGLSEPERHIADIKAQRVLRGTGSAAAAAAAAADGKRANEIVIDQTDDEAQDDELLQRQLESNAQSGRIMQDMFMNPHKKPSKYYVDPNLMDSIEDVVSKDGERSGSLYDQDEEISSSEASTSAPGKTATPEEPSGVKSPRRRGKPSPQAEPDAEATPEDENTTTTSSGKGKKKSSNPLTDGSIDWSKLNVNQFYMFMNTKGLNPNELSPAELKKVIAEFESSSRGNKPTRM